jgi:pyruvate/2-oxoglutarate/acetoin dehydrogenase E1 component
VKTNGFGAEVVAVLVENAFDYLDAPIIRVTAPDTPVPYSRPLEDDFIPQERDIISAIKEIL